MPFEVLSAGECGDEGNHVGDSAGSRERNPFALRYRRVTCPVRPEVSRFPFALRYRRVAQSGRVLPSIPQDVRKYNLRTNGIEYLRTNGIEQVLLRFGRRQRAIPFLQELGALGP